MTREPDPSIVDRWLAGEATPDDERALREWTAADPARAAWLEALRARATAPEGAWNVDAAWARVANRTTLASDGPRTLRVERGGARRAPRRLAWVGRAAAAAVLGAGQLGRLSRDGTLTVSRAPADERYLAWTTGVLVLDGEPLRDALPRLERRYDLTIRLADGALGARPVVARFRDQPAGEMLDALALALGARYERQGRVVTFHTVEAR